MFSKTTLTNKNIAFKSTKNLGGAYIKNIHMRMIFTAIVFFSSFTVFSPKITKYNSVFAFSVSVSFMLNLN